MISEGPFKELFEEITRIKTDMRGDNIKLSLVLYEQRRLKPPFYFNKQITRQKRAAVVEYLNNTTDIKDLQDIKNFIDMFFELKETNKRLREKGDLKGIIAKYESRVNNLARQFTSSLAHEQDVISNKMIWLYLLRTLNEKLDQGLDPTFMTFIKKRELELKAAIAAYEPNYTSNLESILSAAGNEQHYKQLIEDEIQKLAQHRKEMDALQLEQLMAMQLNEEELTRMLTVREKIREFKEKLIVQEKEFLWQKRHEGGEAFRDSGTIDKLTMEQDYFPWLTEMGEAKNLVLPLSQELYNTFKQIEDDTKISHQEIKHTMKDFNSKIEKYNDELEKSKIDITGIKKTGKRSVRTQQDWLKRLSAMITKLLNLLKPKEGESEAMHPPLG